MKTFDVEVIVAGKPRYETRVRANDEWHARKKAMITYPHRLCGAFVDYAIREVA